MIPARTRDPSKVYEHAHHAGNVGDVWKHAIVAAVIAALPRDARHEWIDTHSAAGRYNLAGAGEWDAGVVRIAAERAPPAPVATLLGQVEFRDGRPRRYPGSPALAAALLGANTSLRFCELHEPTCARLRELFARDTRVQVHVGDGFALLQQLPAFAGKGGARRVVLIDPPFAAKEEWDQTAAAVVSAARRDQDAIVLAWYPIKGMTRPAFLRNEVRRQGVSAVALELITAPTDEKRNRLNGSGVLAVNLPQASLEAIALTGAWLGPRLALRTGHYSVRIIAGAEAPAQGG